MSPIAELLMQMRPRPALYIGGESVVKLAAFLRGYSYALDQHCSMNTHEFLAGFRDWVANRFSVTISQSWENIIQFHSVDDKEAMQLFWKLLDEYLAQHKTES
jgi:hypothetical protein